jgi:hypothetical protein
MNEPSFVIPPNPDVPSPPWAQGLWTGEGLETTDLEQAKQFQREQFDLFFPRLPIKRLDRKRTPFDPIRGEPQLRYGPTGRVLPPDRQKRFLAPIYYPTYPDHHPRENTLIKYGMDHPRDAAFTYLDFVLRANNVILVPGDLIEWEGQDFEIKAIQAPTMAYWVNTPFHFYFIAFCDLYRTEGNRVESWRDP